MEAACAKSRPSTRASNGEWSAGRQGSVSGGRKMGQVGPGPALPRRPPGAAPGLHPLRRGHVCHSPLLLAAGLAVLRSSRGLCLVCPTGHELLEAGAGSCPQLMPFYPAGNETERLRPVTYSSASQRILLYKSVSSSGSGPPLWT